MTKFWSWAICSLIWAAGVAFFAWNTWPRVPFDISANDPASRAALDSAVIAHIAIHAVWAILLPLMALVFGRLLGRMRIKTGETQD